MTCEHVKMPGGGHAIVCTGKRTRRKCACGNFATLLCDYPKSTGAICNKPLCSACAAHVGEDIDYCKGHGALAPVPAQGVLAL